MTNLISEKKRRSYIRVMPFVTGKPDDNFGLTKYNEVLFPGTDQKISLVCLEKNGASRYITGLDEFAPEVLGLAPERKKAVQTRIRKDVAFLERSFGANEVKVEDNEFWSKVKTVHPSNHDFWKKQELILTNAPRVFSPEDPSDLLLLRGIEAGGFPEIAPSYEDAQRAAIKPKFYLDREVETSTAKVGIKRIKNEAVVNLQALSKDPNKMLLVAKIIDPQPHRYQSNTSQDVIYDFLDSYIAGEAHERTAKRAAENFNKVCDMKMEELAVKAAVSEANIYKLVERREGGKYYHRSSGVMLGTTMEDINTFYLDAANAGEFKRLTEELSKFAS